MWMTLEHLVPCELFTMELDGCGREGGRERERKIPRSYSSGVRNLSSSCGFRRTPVKLAEA